MQGCKTGDTLVLRGVNFDFDQSTLTANAKTILDQVAEALNKRTDIKVELDGHTDGKGWDEYNMRLSQRRALPSASAWRKSASIVRISVGPLAGNRRSQSLPTSASPIRQIPCWLRLLKSLPT